MKIKKIFKWLMSILAVFLLIIISYLIYGYTTYYRLPDTLSIQTERPLNNSLTTNQSYIISTFNIGYGSYPQDYSFFMDGGTYSRAYNQETVLNNMTGITHTIQQLNPDIALFQEVDVEGDRSQHVDEVAFLTNQFSDKSWLFTQNYDSAFLFYPILDPIGKAKSGLLTMANSKISDSTRYSLPIETNFNKFFDLDRAFVASHLPVSNGKTLTLINIHLSAYTKDPSIGQAQLDKLFGFMEEEYQKGNYVIVGGDYNHDVLQGDSPKLFQTTTEVQTWTHPFPTEQLSHHFRLANDGLREQKIPSARALDQGYQAGITFVTLVDGFIISDNVTLQKVSVHDGQFMNSDHNPVSMQFMLTE